MLFRNGTLETPPTPPHSCCSAAMKTLAVSWALALSLVFAGQRAHAAACPDACATCAADGSCLTCVGAPAVKLVDGVVSC